MRQHAIATVLTPHVGRVLVGLAVLIVMTAGVPALIDAGAKVEKFEMIEPSLHNIFIEKVNETG